MKPTHLSQFTATVIGLVGRLPGRDFGTFGGLRRPDVIKLRDHHETCVAPNPGSCATVTHPVPFASASGHRPTFSAAGTLVDAIALSERHAARRERLYTLVVAIRRSDVREHDGTCGWRIPEPPIIRRSPPCAVWLDNALPSPRPASALCVTAYRLAGAYRPVAICSATWSCYPIERSFPADLTVDEETAIPNWP